MKPEVLGRRRALFGLAGIFAGGLAPAVVRSQVLMPSRAIITPPTRLMLNDYSNWPEFVPLADGRLVVTYQRAIFLSDDGGATWGRPLSLYAP